MKLTGVKRGLVLSAIIAIVCTVMMKIGQPDFPKPLQDHFTNPIMALEFIQTTDDLDTVLSVVSASGSSEIESRTNFLIKALQWDFPFIIGYGLLLYFLILGLTNRGLFRTGLIIATLLIVFSDVLENVYSLKILEGYGSGTNLEQLIDWQYRFVLIKWILLFILILVLIIRKLRMRMILGLVAGLIYVILLVLFLNNPFYKTPMSSNITELLASLTFLIIIFLILNQILAKNNK